MIEKGLLASTPSSAPQSPIYFLFCSFRLQNRISLANQALVTRFAFLGRGLGGRDGCAGPSILCSKGRCERGGVCAFSKATIRFSNRANRSGRGGGNPVSGLDTGYAGAFGPSPRGRAPDIEVAQGTVRRLCTPAPSTAQCKPAGSLSAFAPTVPPPSPEGRIGASA